MKNLKYKEIYQEFCDNHQDLPFFYKPWWLTETCGYDHWNVCLSFDKGSNLIGVLPYFFQKKMGFMLIRMPILTPYLGPVFLYPEKMIKESSRYAFEKKVSNSLIEQLPSFSFFNQHFHPILHNPLPFYWKGFDTQIMVTYQLDLSDNLSYLEEKLTSSCRNDIRKAQKESFVIRPIELSAFKEIHEKTFFQKGTSNPISNASLDGIQKVLVEHQEVCVWGCFNRNNELAAAVYAVFDYKMVYTLMIGSNKEIRSGGAVQFLIWQLVQYAKEGKMDSLDFCGTMIESIEPVFRSFGAKQKNYIKVRKISNPVLKISRMLFQKPA